MEQIEAERRPFALKAEIKYAALELAFQILDWLKITFRFISALTLINIILVSILIE